MSFQKAQDLMRIAEIANSRHRGICLNDVEEEFGVNHRTAQRMMRAFELAFPSYTCTTDADRRRRWKIPDTSILSMRGLQDTELVALDMAIVRARRDGAEQDARVLTSIRDRLLATIPSLDARRAQTDAAALLEAQGFACRPGPQVKIDPRILGVITIALKTPFSLEMLYQGVADAAPKLRHVEPYGMLLGTRQYLIAVDVKKRGEFRRFRTDRIKEANITGQSFRRDPEFDLAAYAKKSFGSYHSDAEYRLVRWRFTPDAAKEAREFEFHPTQIMTEDPDGSLLVEFTASGWLEMAWHLYQWGDRVDVLAPAALRDMVADHRRGDWPSPP